MPQPRIRILAARALGGGAAIALMIFLSELSATPLAWIPFATSIVMVMGSPEAPPAKPLRVLGGHMICATCGLVCVMMLGYDIWLAALAIGLAIPLMHLFDVFHPPAGISPIIIASSHATPLYILSPVLLGVAILLFFAFIVHRTSGDAWP